MQEALGSLNIVAELTRLEQKCKVLNAEKDSLHKSTDEVSSNFLLNVRRGCELTDRLVLSMKIEVTVLIMRATSASLT